MPVAEEFMGTPLEKDSHLKAVRRNSPYASEEEYMDTYFRLLRVECFSAIQKVFFWNGMRFILFQFWHNFYLK